MIASKFGIGQQVRHTLLGYLGVVVDIDPGIPLMNRQQTIWPLTQSFAPRPVSCGYGGRRWSACPYLSCRSAAEW